MDEKIDTKSLGLSEEEARKIYEEGKGNIPVEASSKTTKDIVKENLFTYFNLVFLIIAILLIVVGSFRDLTFLPIIIANTLIGIVQEIRSKKVIDKLSMLNAPTARVVRSGKEREIDVNDLVLGDVIILKSGDQISADAVVVKGHVSVNESLLTGEADEIVKEVDSELLSGSFIVSGSCYAKLIRVGAESYISRLTLQAKKMKSEEQSQIIRSLNRIVKLAGIAIIPIGLILFSQQFILQGETLRVSVQAMVASVIGMIPEGLFLLASVTLAISAMRLAQKKVLLHDMKSIETLARVDVLCVDKTGTITDGTMKVDRVDALERSNISIEEINEIIGSFVSIQSSDNITMEALKEYFGKYRERSVGRVFGFSSEFKYSGAEIDGKSYVLGAPENVLGNSYSKYESHIASHAKKGLRVLAFGLYEGILDGKKLTNEVVPYAFVVLSNPIRKNAKETFSYFKSQGVKIKVISGDNPVTVAEVAKSSGIDEADKYVDARGLKTDEEIENAILNYTVFGRVTPEQKRKFVSALQKNGHTVAMTGDGVNDILALKDADCSIAMASGSDAARQVAQLVLLESDFSKMPEVVREGRQVVNNLERSASLFLVKNIFSFLISILAIFFSVKYPLEPAQISLISMFTIGIPAFFLSQVPNEDIIRGNFLKNVLFKAIPGGLVDTFVVAAMVVFANIFGASASDISTASTVLLAMVGLMVLQNISKPMDKFKWAIFGVCTGGLVLAFIFLKDLFSIAETMSIQGTLLCINFVLISEVCLRYLTGLFELIVKIKNKLWSYLREKGYTK